ncbi:MAG TPA: DNA mismatch repair endonuclease MutL, partial [Blastocatellia bacterium]|nr:DNA mismatch repair endonuclease MutL [Blastocatellia bacterium]
ADDMEGTEVEFNGGKLVAVRDIAWPGGTEIEVRDLFFNIPARRKFLKSDATESVHITNLVQHYALANPEVAFLLVNNGRDAIRVAPARALRERAYQVLGGGLLGKLVEVRREEDGLSAVGFVSNPQEQRSSRDAQYLFVNRRFVKDQLIGRALTEAYRSMMPSGSYPAAILFIDVPPSEVDVNVHPAKTEVRFLHEGRMTAFIRDAVAAALEATRPVTRLPGTAAVTREEPEIRRPVNVSFTNPPASPVTSWRGMEIEPASRPAAFERGHVDAQTTPQPLPPLPEPPAVASDDVEPSRSDLSFLNDARQVALNEVREASAPPAMAMPEPAIAPQQLQLEDQELPGLGHGIKPLGQIRDSYIVATDDEGLLLLDQHAAHERVLFEQFRDEKLARSLEVQQLLIPETLDLSPAEAEAFKVVQQELETVGVETMQLSGRTIAVKTAPCGLTSSDVTALVREALAVVERERRNFKVENLRDAIAASLACKAAIKVNMPLTKEKMEWLIDELMQTQNSMTCPHGRPTIMRYGLREIERGFKRPV